MGLHNALSCAAINFVHALERVDSEIWVGREEVFAVGHVVMRILERLEVIQGVVFKTCSIHAQEIFREDAFCECLFSGFSCCDTTHDGIVHTTNGVTTVQAETCSVTVTRMPSPQNSEKES